MSETAAAPAPVAPSVPSTPAKETLKSLVLSWAEAHSVVAPSDPSAKRRNSLLRAKTEATSIIAVLSDVPAAARPASVSAMLKAQEDRLAGIETAIAALPAVEPVIIGREAGHDLVRAMVESALGIAPENVLFV